MTGLSVSVGSSHTRVTESPVQLATLTPVGGGGGAVGEESIFVNYKVS